MILQSIKIQINTINVINGLTHVLGHAHFHVLSLKLLHHLGRFLGIHHLVHLLHRLKHGRETNVRGNLYVSIHYSQ